MNKLVSLKGFELRGYNDESDIAVIVGDIEFSGKEILNIASKILEADPHLSEK